MKTKKIILGGFFVALGVIIPMLFHMVKLGGPIFLPMHIPVLLAGLLLGGEYGLIVGFLTPIISSVLTGMPPMMPVLPIMTVELAVYGLISGLLFNKFNFNVIISLIISMICGRIGAFIVVYIMANMFGFAKLNPVMWLKGGIITGIPGIAIQIIFIPLLVNLINKSLKGGAYEITN
ncbi:ECF transporter S component [Tepidibacter thalassicus]|uniref:Niacin transporter n=1 Tax=Tepidibacter thalassicus DSM 15285 TaxID=1123350 RepID=A0A1M5TFL7_9FIRM|nr:ECF transporter S component [Tepidibacter thalassicus]SHH49547.1 Protein of unknown function [Tepidibacter thalassicus DSM 15285]